MKEVVIFAEGTAGVVSACCSSWYLHKIGKPNRIESSSALTATPRQFWLQTFLNYDFSYVSEIVVTFMPFQPESDEERKLVFEQIETLVDQEIRVTVLDRHRFFPVDYSTLREAGAEIVIDSTMITAFLGEPDDYTVRLSRLAMIINRDEAVLPVSDEELTTAYALHYALTVDRNGTINSLLADQFEPIEADPDYGQAIIKVEQKVRFAFNLVPRHPVANLLWMERHEESDEPPHYTVGIEESAPGVFNVWVTTAWAQKAIPASILLNQNRITGHDKAFLYGHPHKNLAAAKRASRSIVNRLNQELRPVTTKQKFTGLSTLAALVASMFQNIDIPPWLTEHGWPHEQRVFSHVGSVASLFGVSDKDKRLLQFAAVLHDLGYMAREALNLPALGEQEVRDRHHFFSLKIIRRWEKEAMFENLLDKDELHTVKCLCFAHRKRTNLPKDTELAKLVLLFRLCDALDVTYQRAIYNDQGRHFTDLAENVFDSKRDPIHWNSHRAVLGIRMIVKSNPKGEPLYKFKFILSNLESGIFKVTDLQAEVKDLKELIPSLVVSYDIVPSEAQVEHAFH